jgi:TonB dependent receptor/TonB-dependent Receptor Plug Domain
MKKLTLMYALLMLASAAFAQVDLEVSIFNYRDNTPLSKKTVLLKNEAIGYSMEKQTNEQGKIQFNGLSLSGNYTVLVAETPEFYEGKKTDIVLSSNTNASVALPLIPKTEKQLSELVVLGSTKINARNAEVSSELKQKEIEQLPAEGRDINRLLYRLPNVVQATGFYPEAPPVSINGTNSLYTNYLIDGMDNNERFLGGMKFNIPVGFVRNINVLTNNFSTEYGNSGSGIVNITSRSGSNERTAEAFFVTRPGASIDAPSRFILRDLAGNQVKDGFQRYQGGVGFGGALTKDKTFYYVNAEYTQDIKDNYLVSPTLGVNTTVRGKNNFAYLSGKLDHIWNEKFKSSVRANIGIVNIARQGGGLEGGTSFPSSANYQDRNSVLIASQNTYLNGNFKSETNVQYSSFRWNYGRAANESSPDVSVLDASEQTIAYLGHPGYLFDSHENTLQAQKKLTFYLKNHTLKTGVEVISANHSLFGGGNPNGSYTVKLTDAQVTALKAKNLGVDITANDIPSDAKVLYYGVELRPQSFGTTQNVVSAYVEDAISVSNKLNVSLGLRYDYDDLSKGGSTKGDYNNIAPRLSFNYKLTANSSLRGGYGLIYDKVLYAIYSDALQQNTTSADYKKQLQAFVDKGILPKGTDVNLITYDGNLGATASNVSYLKGPSASTLQEQRAKAPSGERRILNPNGYQNPYTHQFSLGYQQQLSEKHLFYVDFVYNKSGNLFRLRDLNAPTFYDITANNNKPRTQAAADLTRPLPIAADGSITINGEKLTGIARTVVVSESAGESEYKGLSFNLQKDKGDENISYRLIYTLSQLKNNTEDINFRAEQANNFDREYSVSINDRTHVLNGLVSYYPTKNLSITMAALIQSGQPINRIPDAKIYGTTDLNGDGRSFADAYQGNSDRQPGEARNSDRLPWSNTFDIAAEYRFPIGKSGLILRGDVFNLFNAENYSGYFNNATQSNQVQVGPATNGLLVRRNAAPPRQFQFSLRYAF